MSKKIKDVLLHLMSPFAFSKTRARYKAKWKTIKNFKKDKGEWHEYNLSQFCKYKDYVQYLIKRQFDLVNKTEFVDITKYPFERRESDTKIIAIFLPQYYRIDLNDKFHGRGFTEWTNATRVIPAFVGHDQPHLPYDLGFYNLLDPETLKRQAELAKMYGIYGFCIHWYWFSGIRIMEKPVELLLKHSDIDIKYCFNWAFENWTSEWNGGNCGVMIEQRITDEDDYKLFCDLLPYFSDPRYIKINNKPYFSIYNVNKFERERLVLLISNLRKYAKSAGLEGIYISLSTGLGFRGNPDDYGADALQENMPCSINRDNLERTEVKCSVFQNFENKFVVDRASNPNGKSWLTKITSKKYYRSVLVGFDNSSRHMFSKQKVLITDVSHVFKEWLKEALLESKKIHNSDEDIVFINNWNEWAEGSHLEPDLYYGYAKLQAVKECLEEVRNLDTTFIQRKVLEIHNEDTIHFYVHCICNAGDLVACEPIARWLKAQSQNCKVHWIVMSAYREILEFNPNIDEIIEVDSLSSSIAICNEKKNEFNSIIVDCHYHLRRGEEIVHHNFVNIMINENTYFNFGSILQSFCLAAGMPPIQDAPIFWKNENIKLSMNLPDNYVVFHCCSAEANRNWRAERWNVLADSLIAKGYNVVEVGSRSENILKNEKVIDLTKIDCFQEIAKVIENARAFCGVDSAFAHVANCYKIPSCILIGKYKNFVSYIPYTGFFAENRENILYAENGEPASEISVESVLSRMDEIV